MSNHIVKSEMTESKETNKKEKKMVKKRGGSLLIFFSDEVILGHNIVSQSINQF